MTRNEYLAGWLSNASIAVGFSVFAAIFAQSLFSPVKPEHFWLFVWALSGAGFACFALFAAGLVQLKKAQPAAPIVAAAPGAAPAIPPVPAQ
ncbi:hypothetical protein HFO77_23435 [Rhizobium leguminosarum]|uniref:hypothetical protein n=1 Tax=Rhizobium leguminosarum TaxID=384 RepID=UPI001C94E1F5|nr:hypothetical protein [Rhizobium leguminosarum]MBY5917349.1 hypothetical protein [Rhizobium leguminosarum]